MQWIALAVALVATALLIREKIGAKRSNDRFRALVDGSPASVVVFDDETVLYANNRVISIVGSGDASTVIGRPLTEVLAAETAQMARDSYRRIIDTGAPVQVKDFVVLGRNGAAIRCDLLMEPAHFAGVDAVQCAFNPVDEKHAALVALHETEERFQRFFEDMPVPMYRTRLDGTIVHANQALASLLGVGDPADLIDVSASDFYSDPGHRTTLAQAQVDAGLLKDQISRLRATDGRTIWVRDSSRTVVENGIEVFEGALVDVTQEQHYNDLLQRRATQQQTLASIAHVALRLTDAGSVLGQAVEAICDVLGADCALVSQNDEEMGLITTSVAYRIDSVRDRELLLDYIRGQVVAVPETEDPVPLDPSEPIGDARMQGVQIALAGPQEAYGVVAVAGLGFSPTEEDLDFLAATAATLGSAVARSRARAHLDQLMHSKDEFVASVSHELRTPLTVVAGLALELERSWRDFSQDEISEFISLIADQSREMGDLIEDLLVAARADIGKVPIYAKETSLRACVDQVIAACSLAERTRIVVDGNDVGGFVDPVRCRQIIRNLVTNAIRYGGPNIHVSVDHVDGDARLTVFDDGSGVAQPDRDKIFAPYERAHTPGAGGGVPGSVGLGLTVSRKLTELMGGSISYRYDGGSHFEVRLPLAGDSATAG